MRPSELLDLSLQVYQQLGAVFLSHTVLPALMCLGAMTFVATYLLPALSRTADPGSVAVQLEEVAAALGVTMVVALPMLAGSLAYTGAIVTRLTADFMAGAPPVPQRARQAASARMRTLVGISLRVGFVSATSLFAVGGCLVGISLLDSQLASEEVWLGLLAVLATLAVLPAGMMFLWGLSAFGLAVPCAVVEGMGAKDACRRSRTLMRRHPIHGSGFDTSWRLWGVLALILIAGVGGLFLSMELFEVQGWVASLRAPRFAINLLQLVLNLLPWFAAIWIMVPVWFTTTTLLYFERRIRLEGYDIQALAREIPRASALPRFEV